MTEPVSPGLSRDRARTREGRCLAISVAVPEYRLEAGRRVELIDQTRQAGAALRDKLSHYA